MLVYIFEMHTWIHSFLNGIAILLKVSVAINISGGSAVPMCILLSQYFVFDFLFIYGHQKVYTYKKPYSAWM